jgi:predicted transcriptional regulator
MAINAGLKANLQELANAENRTLTNFIETKLRRVAAAPKGNRKSLVPPRQARAAHLTMRVNVELKANLQVLANQQYRTLTDFIEIELHKVVVARKAKRESLIRRRQR